MKRNYAISPWFLFVWLFILLSWKLVERHCFPDPRILQQAQKQYLRRIHVKSNRGIIQDSKGQALVISEVVSSFFISPELLEPEDVIALEKMFPDRKFSKLLESEGRQFAWLKRHVSRDEALKIRSLSIKAINESGEQIRKYPNKTLLTQVLGFCDIDNYGLAGIEKMWNSVLYDPPGYKVLVRQPGATSLSIVKAESEKKYTMPVVTMTVDSRIQYIVEKYMEEVSSQNGAKWASAICMEPNTGEILAMASWPPFDPTDKKTRFQPGSVNNSVSRTYEPGSTFKPIIMGIALEKGLVRTNEIFNCPARLKVADSFITEAYPKAMGNISSAQVLIKSSNVGMAQIGIRAEKVQMYETLRNWGFGKRSDIELPGVAKGILSSPGQWRGVVPANIAIGQGLAVTPLQLITATAPIVNGGKLMSPYIIKKAVNSSGEVLYEGVPRLMREVLTHETSQWLRNVMRQTVLEGTGKNANTPVTALAGKTGTAQVAEAGGYSKGRHVASFIGFWPFEKPKYLMLLVVGEPSKGRYYGGELVAPAFRKIVEEISEIEYLNPEKKGI